MALSKKIISLFLTVSTVISLCCGLTVNSFAMTEYNVAVKKIWEICENYVDTSDNVGVKGLIEAAFSHYSPGCSNPSGHVWNCTFEASWSVGYINPKCRYCLMSYSDYMECEPEDALEVAYTEYTTGGKFGGGTGRPSISSFTHGEYYYYGENIYPVIPDYDDTAYQYALIYDVGNIDDVRFFASNVPWTYVYTGGRYVITNSSPCTIISHRYVNGSWSVVEVIQDDTMYGTQIGAGDLTELWCNVSIKNSSGTVKYTGTSPEPLSSSETYFYYGDYVFPEIPNWDQSIYPYAFLYDIGNIDDIRVFVSTKPFVYVYTNSKYCVANSASCTTVAYCYLNGVWSSNSPVSQSQYGFNVGVTDITKSWFNQDVLSTSGSVKYTGSDPVPITIDSGTNDRFGSYMEELDAWNQSNPYLDNQYTSNYYITPDDGDTLYSPAVFSESTKIFTEPVTGVQYPCTKWIYHYTADNTLTFNGIPIEGNYLGSYILTLSNPVTVNGVSVLNYWIVYMDDSVYIAPFYSVDGTIYFPDYQQYSYAVVSQTSCGVGDHDIKWTVTQEPTCAEYGIEEGICSVCGETWEWDIDMIDHSYEYSIFEVPTCVDVGTGLYTCAVCGDEYEEEIPATGEHTYDSSVALAPACTTTGTMLYTCSVCANEYTETIPATGHTYSFVSRVEAQFDDSGAVTEQAHDLYSCIVCGDIYKDYAFFGIPDGSTADDDSWLSWLGSQFKTLISSLVNGLASGLEYLFKTVIGTLTDWIIKLTEWVFGLFDGDSLTAWFDWFSEDNTTLNNDFAVSGAVSEVDVWVYS